MPTVTLVDTSIFLNVLNVPAFNQDRDAVLTILERLVNDITVSLLLPYTAIIETGNHIAHVTDGRLRRSAAERFCAQVTAAIGGEAPWTPTLTLDLTQLSGWLAEFPDRAMMGVGLGDLTIIKEWEAACLRHPRHRVTIWTLDQHLAGYDRAA